MAGHDVNLHAAVIVASNKGSDFNLVNDAYRDQLIQLFSYSSYHQIEDFSRSLRKGKKETFDLPEDYKLLLTLHGIEKGRVMVQAVIHKGNKQYMDTTVSILRPGVVFLGGPPAAGGVLIIVLETGF